jgi:hypothetical protein
MNSRKNEAQKQVNPPTPRGEDLGTILPRNGLRGYPPEAVSSPRGGRSPRVDFPFIRFEESAPRENIIFLFSEI